MYQVDIEGKKLEPLHPTTYLQRLGELESNLRCYREHLPDEESYAHNLVRIHEAAREAGLSFVTRSSYNP